MPPLNMSPAGLLGPKGHSLSTNPGNDTKGSQETSFKPSEEGNV